jgi:hypothetical protein
MESDVRFTFSFTGNESDEHVIDFYDVSQALIGFQRSIALTTHLVLNDEIITQSPSLKGAKIYAFPPEQGSWKVSAAVVMIATGIYKAGTLPNNTPLGHIVYSLYDYVVSESLGVHVDYNKSLGQLYEEMEAKKIRVPVIRQAQADSLVEKCSHAIKEMHRPIYKTATAKSGTIVANINGKNLPLRTKLSLETFEFIHETHTAEEPEEIVGRISSYNSNTYKGRIYVKEIGRPVAFELAEDARNSNSIRLITSSLRSNALREYDETSLVRCVAFRNTSRSGQLKSFKVVEVGSAGQHAAT